MLEAEVTEDGKVTCHIPSSRSDVIAQCDVAEDLCIAKGYNNIEFVFS